MKEPGPVKIFFRDGTQMGAELVYAGLKDGTHRWEITNRIRLEDVERIECGVLPASTGIAFPFLVDDV